jgi:ferredoxin
MQAAQPTHTAHLLLQQGAARRPLQQRKLLQLAPEQHLVLLRRRRRNKHVPQRCSGGTALCKGQVDPGLRGLAQPQAAARQQPRSLAADTQLLLRARHSHGCLQVTRGDGQGSRL